MTKHFAALLIVLACTFAANAVAEPNFEPEAASPLLKPAPTDHSPFLPIAEAAARSRHPEIFEGRFSGSININVDMNVTGDVLSVERTQFPAGPVAERSLSKTQRDKLAEISLHDAYARAGAQGIKFVGWYGTRRDRGLYLSYRVLKWRLDPTRSVARVQAAVAGAYPQYFRPRPLAVEDTNPGHAILTVVMNDDGTIAAATIVEDPSDEDSTDRMLFDRFRGLGLKLEDVAYRGRTSNQGDWQDRNLSSPLVLIEYAWRRRSDDPLDETLQMHDVFERVSLLHLQEQQSHPPDEAFLEKYFADVWTKGLPNPTSAAWLLLARSGQVLDKGISSDPDPRAIEDELRVRYKNIRVNENSTVGIRTKAGSTASLSFIWIAADSPITPKQATGLER